MDLSVTPSPDGVHTVVRVVGEVDLDTAQRLRERLIGLVTDGQYRLVVDLEGVEFLDSFGLGVLVGGRKRVLSHAGSFTLVCTQESLLKVFHITGLSSVFPIHASVEEAVAAD